MRRLVLVGGRKPLRVNGVGRDMKDPRTLIVILNEEPSDDELRALHEHLRAFRPGDPPRPDGLIGAERRPDGLVGAERRPDGLTGRGDQPS